MPEEMWTCGTQAKSMGLPRFLRLRSVSWTAAVDFPVMHVPALVNGSPLVREIIDITRCREPVQRASPGTVRPLARVFDYMHTYRPRFATSGADGHRGTLDDLGAC